ncbi:MAG TPA: hypothetical protein DD979_07140 [Gammaproteobacteria bacterium]|jgi:hypothetical protein|nr:hypothetical protein [Gammaproteobacteria bacterium]
MGFNIRWIGAQDLPIHEAASWMGLSLREGENTVPEFPISVCETPNGWGVFYFNHADQAEPAHRQFLQQSGSTPSVMVSASESTMTSFAAAYDETGRQLWSLFYPVKAQWSDVVEVGGTLPDNARAVIENAYARQYPGEENTYDVAYLWDVPIEIAKGVTLFRHDEPKVDGQPLVWREAVSI